VLRPTGAAGAATADRRRARHPGFVDGWTKPLDVLRLPQAIDRFLRGRASA
jgi:hypothetical protein